MASRRTAPEIALSAAWHSGEIPSELTTIDGDRVEIIHRGAWSHGLGPDFRDAMVLFNGRELRAGDVEIHVRTRGWKEHGHYTDPRYESVILHVVGEHDGSETRRADGALVPLVEVGPVSRFPVPDFASWDWDKVGGDVCAPGSVATQPAALRRILNQLGDRRLAGRVARLEARMQSEPPAEILWQELLDGLGYSRNRGPMRDLALALPVAAVEDILRVASIEPLRLARGLLLGAAGFLPLSPAEIDLGALSVEDARRLEDAWGTWGAPFRDSRPRPQRWNLARVRPANHPLSRLLAAANMITAALEQGGLVAAVLAMLTGPDEIVDQFQQFASASAGRGLGADRAIDMLASGLIPFALALADSTGDQGLSDAAARHWERLPMPAANDVTRRATRQIAGGAPLRRIGARGAQGLIHLDTTLCQPRRCFECPVAALEIAVNDSSPACQGPESTF